MSLLAAATALSLAGTAGQTFAQVQAAKGQAKAAEAEAASIREAAAFEETSFRRRAAQVMAKGRAIGAASGVDISTGSPLLLELDNARQAELEALNIRRTGQVGAAGKQFEAKLAKAAIPGIILGGVAQSGSVLSNWLARK
jgi:hypothetical protein